MPREEIKIDLLIHDMKNPLSVVQAGLEGLLTKPHTYGSLSPKQERVVRRLLRNTRAAQFMVGDALELGRSATGRHNPESVILGSLIRQVLIDLFDLVDATVSDRLQDADTLDEAREAVAPMGLALTISEADWNSTVTLDAVKIVQILRNLMTNAWKYHRTEVTLAASLMPDGLCFSVADDGEGIPKAYHQRIFDCYFQIDTSEIPAVRGHGVGLAGVLVLVRDLAGDIELMSDAGQGTLFKVRIPTT